MQLFHHTNGQTDRRTHRNNVAKARVEMDSSSCTGSSVITAKDCGYVCAFVGLSVSRITETDVDKF